MLGRLGIILALMLSASTASAQSGINFYLNDCSAGSTLNAVTNACTTNTGTAISAVGSVVLPLGATVTNFIGYAVTIYIQTSQTTIPDWWRGDDCRGAGFAFTTSSTDIGGSCPTLWDDLGATNVSDNFAMYYGPCCTPYDFVVETVRGASVIPAENLNLVGDGATEYSVFKFTVTNAKTVGLGACSGCSYGGCIVLHEIDFEPLVGDPTTWVRIVNSLMNLYIIYNSNGPTCSRVTPTQNRTWGAIKSLYR